MEHDEAWLEETKWNWKDPEVYHWGYRIACLNCSQSTMYRGPLDGLRFWFEREKYYVLIGCPPHVRDQMATNGRWAKNISKHWDQSWGDTETPRKAGELWGFTENDDNIYYVKGWGKEVIGALNDLEDRLEKTLDKGYYAGFLVGRIKDGLRALDPGWVQTEKEYNEQYERDHAKDEVEHTKGYIRYRDGTERRY